MKYPLLPLKVNKYYNNIVAKRNIIYLTIITILIINIPVSFVSTTESYKVSLATINRQTSSVQNQAKFADESYEVCRLGTIWIVFTGTDRNWRA